MGDNERTAPGEYPEKGECRFCAAPVIWCIAEASGKINILDALPRDDGNVALIEGKARYARKDAPLPDHLPRYVSHFATCPDVAAVRAELAARTKANDQKARTAWDG